MHFPLIYGQWIILLGTNCILFHWEAYCVLIVQFSGIMGWIPSCEAEMPLYNSIVVPYEPNSCLLTSSLDSSSLKEVSRKTSLFASGYKIYSYSLWFNACSDKKVVAPRMSSELSLTEKRHKWGSKHFLGQPSRRWTEGRRTVKLLW